MRVNFFSNDSKFDAAVRNKKKIQKMFCGFKKIAFELISLNIQFYGDKMVVVGIQYVNKQAQDFTYY